MTEIQQNRWDQLVRRAANIVAGGSQVNDTLNELFPVLDVENLNAELALLNKWRLGFASSLQGAVAANLNHSQLFNPTDSGMLVVLESIDIRSDTTQNIEYALATAGLTNLTANHALRDTREGILQQPVGQVRTVTQVGGLPLFGHIPVLAVNTFTFAEKRGLFVLAPGTGITFACTTVNTTFNANYLWRERVAEPAELNFP